MLLFVARLGAGVAGATISTAQAVIAYVTGADQRARGMALIGMAFGAGFTLGPLFGFASLFLDVEGAPGYRVTANEFVNVSGPHASLDGWVYGARLFSRRRPDNGKAEALPAVVVGDEQ